MDMSSAIVPKSDQLNSDDLIVGPITIKITSVTIKSGEQPVSIFYEGDDGKPYKCCKSMARILVHAWGADASKYAGRSLTLYRDPAVKWGGMDVGGIRISHMSHIDAALTMALTVTRANKKPFTVRPIVAPKESAAPQMPEGASQGAEKLPPTPTSADAADFISPDQAVDIADRLQEAGIDKARFLKATKVTSIALLPASAYSRALAWIETARAAR